MNRQLSEAAKEWIRRRHLWLSAEERFWREWAGILSSVQQRMCGKEWVCAFLGDPPRVFQMRRAHWPGGVDKVHYEALPQGDPARGISAEVALHVEQGLENHEGVAACLRRLLAPHSARLHKALAACVPQMPEHPVRDVLKGQIPMRAVTVDALCEALDTMAETESFVDEALFLVKKRKVWRTGFLAGDPVPVCTWAQWQEYGGTTGENGGWESHPHQGRLASPCLRCFGRKSNYRDGRNILWLGSLIHDFANGAEVYGSAVVHSVQGGQLEFYAEAPKAGNFVPAFAGRIELEPVDRWQVVQWQGRVANPENHDFAKQGLHAFVMVKAPEAGLRLDSIEIGGC